MITVILTTHDGIRDDIRVPCYTRLKRQCGAMDMELIRMGQRGHKSTLAILTKMHAGLLAAGGDYCYICEHDVLYPDSYFTVEPCSLSYSASAFFLTPDGYIMRKHPPLSSLFGARDELLRGVEELLSENYKRGKIRRMEFGLRDACKRYLVEPFLDIRHGANHTGARQGELVESVPYWGDYRNIWTEEGGINAPEC